MSKTTKSIESTCKELFGAYWKSKIACELGVNVRTVHNWMRNGWPKVAVLALNYVYQKESSKKGV